MTIKLPKFLTNPRHLLPLMLFVGMLMLGVRIGDLWDSVTSGKMFEATKSAQASTEAPAGAKGANEDHKADDHKADATKTDETKTDGKKTEAAKAEPSPARIAPPDDGEVSPAEMEVLKQLSDRRAQLDGRSKELDNREALIRVAEQRVDQKIKELGTLRQQLQSMVSQVSEAQAVQSENLVKIYETMKPEEAARIFETLDLPILLGVIQRMKPARTAPIMAKMAPEKAKELTVALTKQDQLPQIK